jgi:glutathione S-transferase
MSHWIVYGSELSPFTLKVLAMCRYKGLPVRFFPPDGRWIEKLRIEQRKAKLVRRKLPLTYPEFTADDEFPLVPFLFGPNGENLYDSTAIGEWLDKEFSWLGRLIPDHDPALAFLVRLLDEFADEWMLYLVHHFRWKVSATNNDAGQRLARELRWVTLGFDWPVRKFFSARQVRRLPYLFSVAPDDFVIPGLPAERQPPARRGFPATHALIEDSYQRIVLALDDVLSRQPYLFGDVPTMADFSIYGQVGMNLSDPSANAFIRQTSEAVHDWVQRMHRHEFAEPGTGKLALSPALEPLLTEVGRVFVPLMQQNAAAVERFRAAGETRFNERAFNAGRCLYDGAIDGKPFRHVAKTFQAKTWRRLGQAWARLSDDDHHRVTSLMHVRPFAQT